MNIYLDVNRVLLNEDLSPAKHVHEVIKIALENHDVYWLTTHCRGDDTKQVIKYLSFHLKLPTIKLIKNIKPTYWINEQTEAIDCGKDFLWFVNYVMEEDKELLERCQKIKCLIEVNLEKNPNQLIDLIKFL